MPTAAPRPPQPFSTRMVSSLFRALGLYGQQEHPVTNFVDLDDEPGDGTQPTSWYDSWRRDTYTPIADRKARYRVFDDMDYGLVSSILDMYAEEATQVDYTREMTVWIESSNPELVKEGHICLRNLQIEDHAFAITREMCKYGDHFRYLHYATGKGVLGWQAALPERIERLDDYLGRLAGFKSEGIKFRKKSSDLSYPFDLIHFRMLQGKATGTYGMGILDALFTPWRQMTLAEDTVLMYSFRRAASRNMVLVDTNGLGESASMQYLNSVRKKFRNSEFVDPASPNYRKQFNPMTTVEDIFLPVRGSENGTRIEQLMGTGDSAGIADLDHFRRKFFGTARTPQAHLGFEGDINAKATLISQDVRFARAIKRVRRSFIQGVRRAVELHFTFLPSDPEKALYDHDKPEAFSVKMAPINALDEFERLELVKAKVELMEAMAQLGDTLRLPKAVWADYVLREHARLPEAIIKKLVAGVPKEVVGGEAPPAESVAFNAEERVLIAEGMAKFTGLRTAIDRLETYYIDESTHPPARVDAHEILQETNQEVIAGKQGLQKLFEAAKAATKKAAVPGSTTAGQINEHAR